MHTKDEELKPLYENKHYKVVVTTISQPDKSATPVKCYGVEHKQTGVIERYEMSLSQALAHAETDSAVLQNEWWKNQASSAIDAMHAIYSTKMSS